MAFSTAIAACLAVSACAEARAEEIRLEVSPASRTDSLNEQAQRDWKNWEKLLGLKASPAKIEVKFVTRDSLAEATLLAGRSSGLKIELNENLKTPNLESVFSHELAHTFLASQCPRTRVSELFAESFALWISQDDQRLIAGSLGVAKQFTLASAARDFLQERLATQTRALSFHDAEPAQALARLIAESRRLRSSGDGSLLDYFSRSLRACELVDDSLSVALMGSALQSPLSRETVYIVDGVSGETLRERGDVSVARPTASLLKPYLLATLPEARLSRLSLKTTEWNCPVAKAGDLWAWQKALAFSCNGYFLDTREPGLAYWSKWSAGLSMLGFQVPKPEQMNLPRAIGLVPGVEATAPQVVALFRTIAAENREVTDALLETAKTGTLSKTPDSAWFVKMGIAMKSGTIRNQQNEPEHGWIVAVGPRASSGAPLFVAAIHQRGSSPQILLARLRAHLTETFGARFEAPSITRVQILGLVPKTALEASCDGAWIVWNGAGTTELLRGGETPVAQMKEGEARQCVTGPLLMKLPSGPRAYWGRLLISREGVPTVPASEDAEPSERQSRARRGSELILETSEANYITGLLASEYPDGRAETLKALALVGKFNSEHSRHGSRPVCDTTHCQVFGPRNADAAARPGARLSALVREIAGIKIVRAKENWLQFSLGGDLPWKRELRASEIEEAFQLPQPLSSITFGGGEVKLRLGENGQGLRRNLTCEKFRNSLHLPSCPSAVEKTDSVWLFSGRGEGHGAGLDLSKADEMAIGGQNFREILKKFIPGLELSVGDAPHER